MSPEQAQDAHTATVASDLYSLGCTLYHALTGQVPFPDKNSVRQMLRHTNETPKPLFDFDSSIPEDVQDIIDKLLAKSPQDRFGSADQVAQALAGIVPPKTLPELAAVNTDFLNWLQVSQPAASGEIQEVVYQPQFKEFLEFVSQSRL
jgi:serine/threonine-protein kinase